MKRRLGGPGGNASPGMLLLAGVISLFLSCQRSSSASKEPAEASAPTQTAQPAMAGNASGDIVHAELRKSELRVSTKEVVRSEKGTPRNPPKQSAKKASNKQPDEDIVVDVSSTEPEFTDAELDKPLTVGLIAARPDRRVSYFINRFAMDIHSLTQLQKDQMEAIIVAHEFRFQDLLKRRTDFLEHASDDLDMADLLLAVRIDVRRLVSDVFRKIHREVLTKEQRKIMRAASAVRKDRLRRK